MGFQTLATVVDDDILHLEGVADLEIIEADAYLYQPPKGIRYSVVWHDIWPDLCEDNLKEMGTLHRRYGKRCDWQGSWGKELLRHHRRRDKANYCCCGARLGFGSCRC